ncbi:hypothetical protein BDV25DRAFT_77502 [Aspergillus avenaceus]|uniref:Uncharacterized protein n=1 Tax=Aspergillus avenaceus TaxID=36643 RepID=A0A5N6TG43_ASPAV|nr:hypothetical protein BDV25DRAFT_77502 [Aspergillus avenaceus]
MLDFSQKRSSVSCFPCQAVCLCHSLFDACPRTAVSPKPSPGPLNIGFPEYPVDAQDREVYTLSTTKARMILNLLDYTYNKSTRLEPIPHVSATQLRDNELRKLIVHYAACKIRDLTEHCPLVENTAGMPYPHKASAKGLRPLLDTTAELASDLVYRTMM